MIRFSETVLRLNNTFGTAKRWFAVARWLWMWFWLLLPWMPLPWFVKWAAEGKGGSFAVLSVVLVWVLMIWKFFPFSWIAFTHLVGLGWQRIVEAAGRRR